jgi:hypothetical protein
LCIVSALSIANSVCFAGRPATVPPDQASPTAIDVLSQLDAGTIPPIPNVVGAGSNSNPGSLSPVVVPEPATLSLLTLGGLTVLRKRRKQ